MRKQNKQTKFENKASTKVLGVIFDDGKER